MEWNFIYIYTLLMCNSCLMNDFLKHSLLVHSSFNTHLAYFRVSQSIHILTVSTFNVSCDELCGQLVQEAAY